MQTIKPCPFCNAEMEPFGPAQHNHPRNHCWLQSVRIMDVDRESWNSRTAQPVRAATSAPKFDRAAFTNRVLLGVAEIPDRNSPEDQPEMMLVTSEELSGIIASAFETADESAGVPHIERDAALLDFVIENSAFILWTLRDGTIKQCQLMNQDEDEDFHTLSGPEDRYFNTPREAIIAAMAAHQSEKP